ncbi:hypothetical protein RHMOL_Rhmol07G0286500 [Rhododendron molle]|uniref:Uncharacterized protein n=1 Tax=Rhododendron molle TaxID=49168 RepID=A0ACC0N612_RHOML|nr:hypothetical protein RHMOL_Rhmol07G0286500 [Rhododendron molle]
MKKPLSRTLAALSKTHGPIVLLRFGSRPVLVVSSPSAAEECLTKNDVVFANRPKLLAGKHLGHNYTTITWSSYGQHLRNLRRIASTEILSASRIQMLKTIRFDEVRLLLGRLYRSSSDGDYIKVDMKSVLFEVTLNNMMRMIAGKRYYGDKMGGLEQQEETRKFKEMATETFLLGGATNIGDFVPVLNWFGLNGLDKRLKVLQQKRDTFMQDLIEEHRRENKSDQNEQRDTMVDVLLSLNKDEPEFYTDEIISGIVQVCFLFLSPLCLPEGPGDAVKPVPGGIRPFISARTARIESRRIQPSSEPSIAEMNGRIGYSALLPPCLAVSPNPFRSIAFSLTNKLWITTCCPKISDCFH